MSETLPIDASREQLFSQRTAELKRMRFFAVALLVLMTGVFGVTSALAAWWPFLVYPRAFAEAAMVGACADWFAVVALFRHPLGLPIPHTAIVPRHKKRIGDALGRFISVNFLAPEEVAAKLQKIDAAGWISSWFTFRTIATMTDFTTNYVVVGDLATAATLSAFGFVVGPFIYLGHEMTWDYYASPQRGRPRSADAKKLLPAPA
jgi:uncharacterized membrane-anchored protein YjiN (DUF445 family)